jgi:hypothetical protein
MSNGTTLIRLRFVSRSDASFEALKQKLASVMPTHASDADDASHPASATQTLHRVSAPPPHLPSLVEDPARKSSAEVPEADGKRKDDR